MQQVRVAFIWHMHQPWYLWPGSREAALPFARLHGYGAYTDMPWLAAQFHDLRITFNLVPSLMAQLAGYADETLSDPLLDLCRKPARDLTDDERVELLAHFSAGHPDHLRELSTRYAQLWHKRGPHRNGESLLTASAGFDEEDVRDLQVWHNLGACGHALRREGPVACALWAKDRGFTEDDKAALLAELTTALGQVPVRLRQSGAELTTSPYYHPILPLLCDMRDASRRIPREDLPAVLWQAPEEARRQLARAREYHAALFGEAPRGLWPSEGAVSDAALALVQEAGFGWAASDEEVLLHSLRDGGRLTADELYQPYRFGDGGLSLVFRDHGLSDRVGFTYHAWKAEDAAADMLGHLERLAGEVSGSRPPLVCIVLDGENPWGSYRDGGEGFLRGMYAGLEQSRTVRATTVSDYLAEFPPTEHLASVFPGSWIDRSYRTWIGGAHHRQAWTLLRGAHEAVSAVEPRPESAWEALQCAEGSDWFWWYSEFHHDEFEPIFDELFRARIEAVYGGLDRPAPDSLRNAISTPRDERLVRNPAGMMQATIDGQATGYFEWQAAGLLRTAALASAMHRTDCVIREIHVGFGPECLYLRLDTTARAEADLAGCQVRLTLAAEPERDLILEGTRPGLETAVGAILEARVALGPGDRRPTGGVAFALAVECGGRTIERWPQGGCLAVDTPEDAWMV